MSPKSYDSYTYSTPPTRNLYQQPPRREITKMVAENPLSNGDDRGPSLPPEPLGSSQPIEKLSSNMITALAQLAAVDEACKKLSVKNAGLLLKIKKSTESISQNSPAMAIISPPPFSNPSNNIRANPTRAETSLFPIGTSLPIFVHSSTSKISENRENLETSNFQDMHHHIPSDPHFQVEMAPHIIII